MGGSTEQKESQEVSKFHTGLGLFYFSFFINKVLK